MTADLVGRLREREQQEREIAANSEVVFELLKPQLDTFNARQGGHNTYAVRMALDHRNSAKKDAAFADTLSEAAARIEALEAALIQARSDLHLLMLGTANNATFHEAKAARDRVHAALTPEVPHAD